MSTLKLPNNGTVMLIGNALETGAITYAKNLLCVESQRSEALFNTGAHPDFKLLKPEKEEGTIKIDEVRDFITWNRGKPQIAKKKVGIISPAHALNLQAANALLKTLEEPSVDSLFILVTHQPSLLPATIRSRCHKIVFRENDCSLPQPELKTMILNDLAAIRAGNANLIILAEQWIKHEPKLMLSWLYSVVYGSLKQSPSSLGLEEAKLYWKFIDAIIDAQRFIESKIPPNLNLLFESLLIQYSDMR